MFDEKLLEVTSEDYKRVFDVTKPIWITYKDFNTISGWGYSEGRFVGFEEIHGELSLILMIDQWESKRTTYSAKYCSNDLGELKKLNGDVPLSFRIQIG